MLAVVELAAADKPESVTAVMVLAAVVFDPFTSVMVTPPFKIAPVIEPVLVDKVGPVVGVLNDSAVLAAVAVIAAAVENVTTEPLIAVIVAVVPPIVAVIPTCKLVADVTVVVAVPAAAKAEIGKTLLGVNAVPATEDIVGMVPAKPFAMELVMTVVVAVELEGEEIVKSGVAPEGVIVIRPLVTLEPAAVCAT